MMDKDLSQMVDDIHQQLESDIESVSASIPDSEVLEVSHYPENEESVDDSLEEEIESLVQAAQEHMEETAEPQPDAPIGYVSNARNVGSSSDAFQFWAPAEETSLGIGSLVRHTSDNPATGDRADTYGILTAATAFTLGLDDYAIHVYEKDARPPLDSITPVPSRRRPVVNYKAEVIASTQEVERPVLSGPVNALKASELAHVHKQEESVWPSEDHMLLGFYEDNEGDFGAFAEERTRVLGPRQGHVIFSGLPGAGKTSLFLTLVISLYAQLNELEGGNNE